MCQVPCGLWEAGAPPTRGCHGWLSMKDKSGGRRKSSPPILPLGHLLGGSWAGVTDSDLGGQTVLTSPGCLRTNKSMKLPTPGPAHSGPSNIRDLAGAHGLGLAGVSKDGGCSPEARVV